MTSSNNHPDSLGFSYLTNAYCASPEASALPFTDAIDYMVAKKNIYVSPDFVVIIRQFEGILCASVGGGTGYYDDDLIVGDDLYDDDEW